MTRRPATPTAVVTGGSGALHTSSAIPTRSIKTSHRVSSVRRGWDACRALLHHLLALAGVEITTSTRPYRCPLCGSIVLPDEKGDNRNPDEQPVNRTGV